MLPTSARQRPPEPLLGYLRTISALPKQIERIDAADGQAYVVLVAVLPVDPRATLAADDALGLGAGAECFECGGRGREAEGGAGGRDAVVEEEERAGLLAALGALAGAALDY